MHKVIIQFEGISGYKNIEGYISRVPAEGERVVVESLGPFYVRDVTLTIFENLPDSKTPVATLVLRKAAH